MDEVRLVDLEIIKRYSLAVRRDRVPADELLAALEASQATVRAALADDHGPEVRRPRKAARTSKATTTAPPAKAIKPARPAKATTPAGLAKATTPARPRTTNDGPGPARRTSSRRGGA